MLFSVISNFNIYRDFNLKPTQKHLLFRNQNTRFEKKTHGLFFAQRKKTPRPRRALTPRHGFLGCNKPREAGHRFLAPPIGVSHGYMLQGTI